MKSPGGDSASPARLLPHFAAAAIFAALAVAWTFPLVLHLSTHVPGPVPGDNVGFLWNFWWMRTALASEMNVFYTPYLFVPAGADLTLHTHSALPAFLGATVLAPLPLVAAQNLAILSALFLNGYCAYLLAWRLTHHHGAAIIGGLVYGGSPYIAAHLNEHFNLISAWTIPLFAMTASEAIRGSTRAAIMAGLVAGLTAYVDYYYVVFEFALVACLATVAVVPWSVAWNAAGPRARRLATLAGLLLAVDVGLIVAIGATGGFDARIGPIRVSAHEIFNPLQAMWILLGLFLALRLGPRITTGPLETPTLARVTRAAPVMLAVFLISAAPIVWNGITLIARGEYVSQPYFWRSAPKGIDLATLVVGHPFHGLWGDSVRSVYRALGIDPIESIGWLGVTPLVLAGWALRGARRRSLADSGPAGDEVSPATSVLRQWTAIGMVFFVWSLGPHLMVFGTNTGMILPQAFMRYVPLVANARLPGRAMVVVSLAVAVLAAVGVAAWRRRSRTGNLALAAIAVAVIADDLPAPFPLLALDRPAIYETLRNRPEPGAVGELPLGIRDGLAGQGAFEYRTMFHQTIHRRPMLGGMVSRLPQAVTVAYAADPLLATLLRLSASGSPLQPAAPAPDRELAAHRLRVNDIRFIVLNTDTAPPALVEYVERVLPLTLIAQEDARRLYLVR